MQFQSLHLENFQAHKDTTVKFTGGLNTIIGESDVGKSSILRALRKLVRDIPAGKDFINKDATAMKISLTLIGDDDQQYVVVRQVTSSKNLYYLDDQEFGGFGREVPEEIRKVLEMFLVELENNEKIDLHFFDQHDVPFMVSKGSAGTRSKLLGRISGLHILDRGIIAVNKDIRAGNSALKAKSAQRDEFQAEVECAKDTTDGHKICDACNEALKVLETDIGVLANLQQVYAQLKDVASTGKQLKDELDNYPEIDADFPEMRANLQQVTRLKALAASWTDVDAAITALPVIDVDTNIDFDGLRTDIQQVAKLRELQNSLAAADGQIITLEATDFDKDIKAAQKLWTDMLVEMKICPVCKQDTHHMGEQCE